MRYWRVEFAARDHPQSMLVKNERDRETEVLKGAGESCCFSCQTRMMDISHSVGSLPIHLDVLRVHEYTRRHTTRVRTRAFEELALQGSHTNTHVSPLVVNASAFTLVISCVNAAVWNVPTIASLVQQHPSTSQFRFITPFFNTCASACVCRTDADGDWRTNDNWRWCVYSHVCEYALRFVVDIVDAQYYTILCVDNCNGVLFDVCFSISANFCEKF